MTLTTLYSLVTFGARPVPWREKTSCVALSIDHPEQILIHFIALQSKGGNSRIPRQGVLEEFKRVSLGEIPHSMGHFTQAQKELSLFRRLSFSKPKARAERR
jgi:hypothetical protein